MVHGATFWWVRRAFGLPILTVPVPRDIKNGPKGPHVATQSTRICFKIWRQILVTKLLFKAKINLVGQNLPILSFSPRDFKTTLRWIWHHIPVFVGAWLPLRLPCQYPALLFPPCHQYQPQWYSCYCSYINVRCKIVKCTKYVWSFLCETVSLYFVLEDE